MSLKRTLPAVVAVVVIGASQLAPAAAHADDDARFEVFAGTGMSNFAGDGGPAVQANIYRPAGMAVAQDGTVYISDAGHVRIRAVAPDGTITTVAGTGYQAPALPGNRQTSIPTDAAGTDVDLSNPGELAVGPDGTLYIVDDHLHQVFALSPQGRISVLAGTGTAGYSGDGGPANLAKLDTPQGVATAPDGTVYIADTANNRLRMVSRAGIITTVAGTGEATIDGPDGGTATETPVSSPNNLAVDSQGSVWMDIGGGTMRFHEGGVASVTRPRRDRWQLSTAKTPASDRPYLDTVDWIAAGRDGIYAIDGSKKVILRLNLDRKRTVETLGGFGSLSTNSASITVAPSGDIYVADFEWNRVYKFRPAASRESESTDLWPLVIGLTAVAVLCVVGGWLVRRRTLRQRTS